MMDILRTASLVNLKDGEVAAQIDAELVRIHADCVDRPELKKPRTLVIQLSFTPDGQKNLEFVDTEITVKSTLPPTKLSRPMKNMQKRNGFGFDADTNNVDHSSSQRRLDGIDADGDE